MAASAGEARTAFQSEVRVPGAWRPDAHDALSLRTRTSQAGDRERRRASFAFGVEAEASVAQFLRAGGYSILARRARVGGAEVDVVASREGVVAFVEVKARRRGTSGYYSVDRRKQARISTAAEVWVAENPSYARHAIRFDMALVWPGGRIDYVENAFDEVVADGFVW